MLVTIFIFFALATSLWPIIFSIYHVRQPSINPISLEFIFNFPVLVATIFIGPIFIINDYQNNSGYCYALIATVVQNFSLYFGTIFFFIISRFLKIEKIFKKNKASISRSRLLYAEKIFIIIYIFSFYFLSSAEFGFFNWITQPRLGYQLYRSGQGHWYAICLSSLSAAITCRYFSYEINPKILKILFFYVPLAFLLGSKAYLLSIFVFSLISIWFYNPRRVNLLLMVMLPASFLVMIVNFFHVDDEFSLIELFKYFDYYKNAADYYSGYINNEIQLFNGSLVYSSLWEYIPRSIYPDKPYIYGGVLVADIFYPGAAMAGHTPAFGGGVLQFADFGWLGLVLLNFLSAKSFFMGVGSYLIFSCNLINVSRINIIGMALILLNFSPQFGIFFPGIYYFIVLILALGIIKIFQKKSACPLRLTC